MSKDTKVSTKVHKNFKNWTRISFLTPSFHWIGQDLSTSQFLHQNQIWMGPQFFSWLDVHAQYELVPMSYLKFMLLLAHSGYYWGRSRVSEWGQQWLYRCESVTGPATNQGPVFRSRDLSWPIRGQYSGSAALQRRHQAGSAVLQSGHCSRHHAGYYNRIPGGQTRLHTGKLRGTEVETFISGAQIGSFVELWGFDV